jgi:serine/threonine protein kinase
MHSIQIVASVLYHGIVREAIPATVQVDNMLLHWPEGARRPVMKLCDFGYSRFQAKACSTGCGTPEYMAPEVRGVECRGLSDRRQLAVLHLQADIGSGVHRKPCNRSASLSVCRRGGVAMHSPSEL